MKVEISVNNPYVESEVKMVEGLISSFYRQEKPRLGLAVFDRYVITPYGGVYYGDVPTTYMDTIIEVELSNEYPDKILGSWECDGEYIYFTIDMSDERFAPTVGELCGLSTR